MFYRYCTSTEVAGTFFLLYWLVMSGGRPSWVDTGGDDDGGASGGYGGGGGNGSSSSSPRANGDGEFDASSFGAISYTHTDRGEIIQLCPHI